MSTLDLDVAATFGAFRLAVTEAVALAGITALFGHSGSGKSTLLRIIAGLERRAEGRVGFGGEIWQGAGVRFVAADRRGVGYVFQDARLFPHLDVSSNLGFALRRAPANADGITRDAVVDALDLGSLLARDVAGLSGGERQRVAIGRSLVARPRLLLMDEPLASLDGRRKREILPYIARLPAQFGIPVIYVTHAVEEVASIADRMLVMSDGCIIASGAVEQVLERLDLGPATGRFEAGVVVRARVRQHDPAFKVTMLDLNGQVIVLPAVAAAVGDEVRIRIRARDVVVATERPKGLSIRNVLEGTLVEIVEEPDTAFAETLIDVGGTRVRARITRLAVADLGLRRGQTVLAMIKSVTLDRPA